ncbi:MAG: hypothetical protein J5861_08885, partial [Desulfovibrio sp.]|nr:hypothetical protein [Desulfovibrio sp.]
VQLVMGLAPLNGEFIGKPDVLRLEPRSQNRETGTMSYSATYIPSSSGHYRYGVRVMPVHPAQCTPHETDLVIWA